MNQESYFSQIFANPNRIPTESARYPYRIANQEKQIKANQEKFNNVKSAIEGCTISELLDNTSKVSFESLADGVGTNELQQSTITPFISQTFTSNIINLSVRNAVAQTIFSDVTAANAGGSTFSQRWNWRTESAQLLSEGDVIESAVSKRRADTYKYAKGATAVCLSRELIGDSSVGELALASGMAATRLNQLVDQMAWHELFRTADETINPDWHNYCWQNINSDSGTITADNILDAMESAYLTLTTRVESPCSSSDLFFILTPSAFTKLWRHDLIRQYNVSGISHQVLRSSLPNFFGCSHVISPMGYFDTSNNFVYEQDCVALVARDCMASRTRQSMVMEPLNYPEKQMEGFTLSTRLRWFVQNPLRFVLCSNAESNDIALITDVSYKTTDLSKSDATVITVNTN